MNFSLMEDRWNNLANSPSHWKHPGDPRAPHVILREGLHSDRFIDTLQHLSAIPNLIRAAEDLADALRERIRRERERLGRYRPLWIFGSPMAGISLGTEVARLILGTDNFGFTEKTPEGELICRFNVPAGALVLRVEEMTTTGGTPKKAGEAILKKNPDVTLLPFVGAYLIRCSRRPEQLSGSELECVISLPELGIESGEWTKEECPLCKAGSRAIKNPKLVWNDLLRTMTDPTHEVPVRN